MYYLAGRHIGHLSMLGHYLGYASLWSVLWHPSSLLVLPYIPTNSASRAFTLDCNSSCSSNCDSRVANLAHNWSDSSFHLLAHLSLWVTSLTSSSTVAFKHGYSFSLSLPLHFSVWLPVGIAPQYFLESHCPHHQHISLSYPLELLVGPF